MSEKKVMSDQSAIDQLIEDYSASEGQKKLELAIQLLEKQNRTGVDTYLNALSGSDYDLTMLAWRLMSVAKPFDRIDPETGAVESEGLSSYPISCAEIVRALEGHLLADHGRYRNTMLSRVLWYNTNESRAVAAKLLGSEYLGIQFQCAEALLFSDHHEQAWSVFSNVHLSAADSDPKAQPRWYDIKCSWIFLGRKARSAGQAFFDEVIDLAIELFEKLYASDDFELHTHMNEGYFSLNYSIPLICANRQDIAEDILNRIIDFKESDPTYYRFARRDAIDHLFRYNLSYEDQALALLLSQDGKAMEGLAVRIGKWLSNTNNEHVVDQLLRTLENCHPANPEYGNYLLAAIEVAGGPDSSAIKGWLVGASPLTRMNVNLKSKNLSPRDIAKSLVTAGAIAEVPSGRIRKADSALGYLTMFLNEKANTLTTVHIEQDLPPDHPQAFIKIMEFIHPDWNLSDVSEQLNSDVARGDVKDMQGVESVDDQGTEVEVYFTLNEECYSFSASPEGSWLDIEAIVKAVNALLALMQDKLRVYWLEIDDSGEYVDLIRGNIASMPSVIDKIDLPIRLIDVSEGDISKHVRD